jgi:uncharacterized PurR-regulated membrane protein YhhQ (DUF165 family)
MALAAYVLAIVIANVLLARGVMVHFGFGLVAPAAVLAVGTTFTFRDVIQTSLGGFWSIGAIVAGTAVSLLIAPAFVLASATAFFLSELADFAVYTPIAQRNWTAALLLSNTVGLVLDSCLFLTLAFGSLAFLPGQLVGKTLMTLLAILPIAIWRSRRGVLAGHP